MDGAKPEPATGSYSRAALAVGLLAAGALFGYLVTGPVRARRGDALRAPGELAGITSVALGPGGKLYAGGEFGVKVLDSDFKAVRGWKTEGGVTALAVGDDGAVYAACATRVFKFDAAGGPLRVWGRGGCEGDAFGLVTGIAVSEGDVFVADANARAVYRFRDDGTYLHEIGGRDSDPERVGFVVPSPYFDVAAGAGVVLVTNPGRLRVERYDLEGRRLGHWGKAGRKDDEFPGCCNPTNIALFADGRVAVSEKGTARVKVFDADGGLLGIFGQDAFDPECRGIDLAVDAAGRIHAVDRTASRVVTFDAGAIAERRSEP